MEDMMQQTMETPVLEQQPPVPQPPAPPPKADKRRRPYTGLMVFTMILALIAAVASCGSVYFYWQSLQIQVSQPEPEVEEIQDVSYITFGDYSLPIHEDLAVNDYDSEAFSVDDNGFISYDGARLGIDVSQHQGEIDWQAVAEDGITFAIIRLGYRGYGEEGTIMLDEMFHQNMAGAKEVGIDVGVYFFSQATSVWETLEEAYFVLEHLDGYELELPVVFNWEFIDYSSYARTNSVPGQSITLYNQVFREQMENAGYESMIYFNKTLGYLYLDLEELADSPFWLAAYSNKPNFYYHFALWQYTDQGIVNGIEGYVDINLMLTDLTQSNLDEMPLEELA